MKKTQRTYGKALRNFLVSLLLIVPSVVIAGNDPLPIKSIREFVIQEKFSAAVSEYAVLIDDKIESIGRHKGAEYDLLAEYAYALALNGIYDGALMNLDRALALGQNEMKTQEELTKNESLLRFYICQVYLLMDYPNIAAVFGSKEVTQPEWITKEKSDGFIQKHKAMPVINQEGMTAALKRANMLLAKKMYFQSLTIFQELIDNFPHEAMPYMGQSKVWEALGYYDKAAELLEKGISHYKASEEAKQPFTRHQSTLQARQNEQTMPPFGSALKDAVMLYAGGTFSSGYSSFDARIGSTDYKTSLSADLSLAYTDAFSCSLGISSYTRQKVLVYGCGIGANLSSSSSFTLKGAAGFSLLTSNGSQSFDVMVSILNYMFPKNDSSNKFQSAICVSVGKSIYFGKRKKE